MIGANRRSPVIPLSDRDDDDTLVLEGVHASRGGVEVLRGIDLTFAAGSRTTIIGPSGSGKSTLLRLLNRLNDPTSGRITLGGRPIDAMPVPALRRRVGLVFQSPRPIAGTVAETLTYPSSIMGRPAPSDPGLFLEDVGLDATWLNRETAGLSGGERARLALAVAFQTQPKILCLDEPTAALDPSAARRIADVIRLRSERNGLTTIAVTHNREHAHWLGDRTIVLEAGRIVDSGPTAEVLARAAATSWGQASPGVNPS